MWPQNGDKMSDYISNRKKAAAVETIEKCMIDYPEMTLDLIDKLKPPPVTTSTDRSSSLYNTAHGGLSGANYNGGLS